MLNICFSQHIQYVEILTGLVDKFYNIRMEKYINMNFKHNLTELGITKIADNNKLITKTQNLRNYLLI